MLAPQRYGSYHGTFSLTNPKKEKATIAIVASLTIPILLLGIPVGHFGMLLDAGRIRCSVDASCGPMWID